MTYLVFSFPAYYPSGGFGDLIGGPAPTAEEAILDVAQYEYGVSDYVQLFRVGADHYDLVNKGDDLRKLIRRAKEDLDD